MLQRLKRCTQVHRDVLDTARNAVYPFAIAPWTGTINRNNCLLRVHCWKQRQQALTGSAERPVCQGDLPWENAEKLRQYVYKFNPMKCSVMEALSL